MRIILLKCIVVGLVLGPGSGCFLTDSDADPVPCLSEEAVTVEGSALLFTTESGVIQTTLTTSEAEPDTLAFEFSLAPDDNSSIELLMPDAVLVYDPEGMLVVYDAVKAVLMRTDAFGSPCTDATLAEELEYAGLPTFAFQGTALTSGRLGLSRCRS